MATAFDRVFTMMGWDPVPTPKWQMIPVNEDRYLYLHDGAGLTVSCTKPAIVEITEVKDRDLPGWYGKRAPQAGDRIFKIRGKSQDNAELQAKSGATVKARLEIDVLNKITKRVAFHFVKDTATPVHSTNRSPAEAAQWVKTINFIYQQCNVEIISKSAATLTYSGDLGAAVEWTNGTTDGWAKLKAKRDNTADLNVFQVWEYEQDGTPATDGANGGTIDTDKMSIVEDAASNVHAHTVAHELAHALGLDDIGSASKKHHLMYGASRTGQNLDRGEVRKIHGL